MIRLFAIFVLFIFHGTNSFAACIEHVDNKSSRTILFVNGILNDDISTCESAVTLRKSLKSEGLQTDNYNFEYFNNPTEGVFGDVTELRLQASISSAARKLDSTNTSTGYYRKLGEIYKNIINGSASCDDYLVYKNEATWNLLKTDILEYSEEYASCQRLADVTQRLSNAIAKYAIKGSVIVIPHSQGNFYTEAAYALLWQKAFDKITRIKVVGVAAISQYPVDNRYLTISQDNALFLLQTINTSGLYDLLYTPAATTIVACATYLPCSTMPGEGQNEDVLGKITGSLGIRPYLDSDSWLKSLAIGYIRYRIPPESRYIFHEFVEVYLNTKLLDASTRKTLPEIVSKMVFDASNELDSASAPKNYHKLPHTGISIDQCYRAGSNILVSCLSVEAIALNDQQDGMRASINPRSYAAVAGFDITECLIDNVTGLMWEGKPSSGPRASSDEYTNFGDSRFGDSSFYLAFVNSIHLCGYSDWRIPSLHELVSIMIFGEFENAVDSIWFKKPYPVGWWSSTRFSDPRGFTAVGAAGFGSAFGLGETRLANRPEYGGGVRLVRGGI